MPDDRNIPIDLEQSEVLQLMLDQMPFIAWFKDVEGRYLAVNKAFVDYTGIPGSSIIGRTDLDIYPEEEARVYMASDRKALDGQDERYFECFVNGIWKEEYKRRVYGRDGQLAGTTGFSRDVSERKAIEDTLRESERSKSVLLSNLPGVAYRCLNDENWTMTFLSDGCYELTGYYPEELLNNRNISYNELIAPEFRQKMLDVWTADIEANSKSSDEYQIITKGGETKWVWEQSVPVPDRNGEMTSSEGFILDITDIKNAVAALDRSEERFRAIFDKAPLGIGIFETRSGKPLQINRKFCEILNRPVQELMEISWKVYSHPDEIQANVRWLKLLKDGQVSSFKMNKRYLRPDGSVIWANLTIVPFKSNTDDNVHLCMIEDITENKKREEEILFLSYHDILTGLYNRTYFEEEQKRLNMSRNLPLSLIMGDLNGLKDVNDTLGHHAGDQFLIEAARIISSCCRKADIVARIGGDEFVILLEKADDEKARSICRRIVKACDAYNKSSRNRPFYMSIALGHATQWHTGESIDHLIMEAEQMLYQVKNAEREQVRERIREVGRTMQGGDQGGQHGIE